MKLEKNMYVRTKDGHIDKIIDTTEEWYELDGDEEEKPYKIYKLNKYYYDEEFDEETKWFLERFFVKASHNIIDLIQSKDLIVDTKNNVYVVDRVEGDYVYTTSKNEYGLIITLVDYQIKSILTKEQFETVSYKVGGNNEDRK